VSERTDPLWSALAFLIGAGALAGISTITGVGLIHVSTTLNKPAPVVLLVLVLLPAVVLGTFSSPRIAVAAVMAAFIAGPSPTKAAVFFFAALVILSRIAVGKTPIVWSPTLWWAIALFSWTLISLGSAVAPPLATKAVAVLFAGILLAIVVLAACRSMKDARWIVGAFVLVAAVLVGRALSHLGQLQAIAGTTQVNNRLTGEFGSPNQLGSFCDLGAFAAVGLAFGARTRLGRLGATLAFGVIVTGLMFSLSRGAWIGAILALVYLLFALREARTVAIAIGAPMIVVAWLIGSFAPGNTQIRVITQRVGTITFASPYDNRKQIYAEAIREIKTRPWVGYGPGDFTVSSLRAGSEASSVYALHAHNLWLTWGAETGIPAVLIIIGLTAALGFAAKRAAEGAESRGDRRDRAVVAGVTAALITVVGQGFVDYTLRNVVIFMALWILVGVVLVMRRDAHAVPEGVPPPEPEAAEEEPHRHHGVVAPELLAFTATGRSNGAGGGSNGSEYDLAVADRHVERREQRLVAQSAALKARRGRLERMREALREQERELEQRAAALERRAAEIVRERDERAEAVQLRARLETSMAAIADRERELTERELAVEREAVRLTARVHELDMRERRLAPRERELEAQAAELALRDRSVAKREAAAAAQERRLASRTRRLEQRIEELEAERRQPGGHAPGGA